MKKLNPAHFQSGSAMEPNQIVTHGNVIDAPSHGMVVGNTKVSLLQSITSGEDYNVTHAIKIIL